MDLYSLKRRDLQALCKKNNIPANLTNAAMADALNSLEIVEGIEEFLDELENGGSESPVRSALTSPSVPQTLTRQKPSKQGLECSKLATRTRGTRRAATEGTDARKTPATRTTRRKAKQETSCQQKTEIDLQAEFEENLEQSEGIESIAISEEVSRLCVDKPEGNIDGEEIVDVDDNAENVDKDCVVNEAPEGPSEMPNSRHTVDFHSLGRKDLQNLCKKNKIPANTTNAAMADALESLETIEGLDEFLKGYDPLAIKSPETSRMTSTRTCQGRTDRKTTAWKSARDGSALCRSLVKKIADLNVEDEEECPASVAAVEVEQTVDKNLQSDLEACLKKPELEEHIHENCDAMDDELTSVSEEVSIKPGSSVDASETVKELPDKSVENSPFRGDYQDSGTQMRDTAGEFQDDVSENVGKNQQVKVDSSEESDTEEITKVDTECSDNQDSGTEICDTTGESEPIPNMDPDAEVQDNISENVGDDQQDKVDNSEESDTDEITKVDTDHSDMPNVDNGLMHETPEAETHALAEYIDEFKNQRVVNESLQSDTLSPDEFSIEDAGSEAHPSANNLKELGDLVNEDASTEEDDVKPKSEEGLDVAEDDNIIQNVDIDPEPVTNLAIEHECLKYSSEEQEMSNAKEQEVISSDTAATLCQAEKLESDSTDDQVSKEFVGEPAAEASPPARKAEETPLPHKSLRTLKRMLKDKLQLQEANWLAKKMEKLALDEDKTLVDSTNSDVHLEKPVEEHLGEGAQEAGDMSEGVNLTTISELDAAVASAPISADNATEDGTDEESNVTQGNDVLAADKTLVCFNTSAGIENSEDSITDHITALESVNHGNSNLKLAKPFDESTSVEQVEGPKPVNFTLQSPCKTPISTGRTKCVMDANKENFDSARKTEAGKINIVLSPMSIGKLKKEVKGLLQQSEKKRTALQSRSDNQFPMAPQNI